MSALHINLLNATDQRAVKGTGNHVIPMLLCGFLLLASLVWGGFVGLQLYTCKGKVGTTRTAISRMDKEAAENKRLKTKLDDLQAEADQYAIYCHGRQSRGELLKRLAFAIPEGVSLTSLTIPPPPPMPVQKNPPKAKVSVPQGPTQMVERVEMRLVGQAVKEEDVFQMMRAIEGNAFTGLVSIVRQPARGERESPRVLAFRQDVASSGSRGVVFDIVYDLKPREFVK